MSEKVLHLTVSISVQVPSDGKFGKERLAIYQQVNATINRLLDSYSPGVTRINVDLSA